MYQQFFNLKETPFAIEPNSRFIILNEEHQEALATLIYAIEQREGWALLLGYPGVGKTTLIMALFQEMGDSVVAGVITNPRLEPLDFFNMVALELGMDGPITSKGQFLVALRHLIGRYRQEGRALLLVVDEAHSLTLELLEEIRLLGNLDDGSPRVLNIFLVGQPQVLRLLKQASDQGLMQRFRRYHILKAMDQEGTATYIRHRIKVAGGDPLLFNPQALAAVYQITGGNCRLINSLCDESLLLAFTREQRTVTKEIVLEASEENPALKLQKSNLRTESPKTAPAALECEEARTEPAPERARDTRPAPPEPGPAKEPAAPKAAARPKKPISAKTADASRNEPDTADELIPGLEPEVDLTSAPAPGPADRDKKTAPEAEVRKPKWPKTKPPRKKGPGGRFAASLSKDAPHGTLKRLLVLLVILGLLGGGYYFMSMGGYGQVKRIFQRLTGSGGSEFFVPQTSQPVKVEQNDPLEAGKKDWGPVAPAPASADPKAAQAKTSGGS